MTRLREIAVGRLGGLLARALAALRVFEVVGAEGGLHNPQSTSGSVKPPTWPDAFNASGGG